MTAEIEVNSRDFWMRYVTTSQYEAGERLGAVPDRWALQEPVIQLRIHHRYRPTIQKWSIERVENAAPWAGVVGKILSIIGSCIVFYTYGIYSRPQKTLAFTREIGTRITNEWNGASPVRRAILDLVGVQLSIDAINASRIQKYAISALTLLTSGICIAAEALISSTLLMTAGKTLAVAAVAIALVTFFWHWSDTARLRQSYSAILRGGVHSSGRPG
ncbi:MAG: hypothetical protein ACHQT8_06520, partial [Chlamydiales bacterium]